MVLLTAVEAVASYGHAHNAEATAESSLPTLFLISLFFRNFLSDIFTQVLFFIPLKSESLLLAQKKHYSMCIECWNVDRYNTALFRGYF